jgi:hypothetical protein
VVSPTNSRPPPPKTCPKCLICTECREPYDHPECGNHLGLTYSFGVCPDCQLMECACCGQPEQALFLSAYSRDKAWCKQCVAQDMARSG